ncbi:MAG: peptidase, partial [Alphaproteobacteria bacterium]|nr:peptidase [Alphaproteobacteria bacterium]
GAKLPTKVNVGLMIEVPSVLFQLDKILPKADFISVGTNDLAQFVFACDRGNPKLLERYDVLSVPFLSVMKTIVDKAKQYGVYCSVCGEMASNPLEALALIGLGYKNLSANGAAFGRVKSMIRSINVKEVSDFVENLLKLSKTSVRSQLISYAHDHGIEIY